MVRNGYGQSGHGTLKFIVSQEWIDGMNWFCMLVQILIAKLFHWFLGGCGQVSKEWVYELSWFFACCEAIMLVRLTLCSLSLTYKCHSTAGGFVGPLAVPGRVLWNRVCLSILLSVGMYSWHWVIRFLWILTLY